MFSSLYKDLQRLLLLTTTAKTFYAFSHLSKVTSKICLEPRYQQVSRKRLLIIELRYGRYEHYPRDISRLPNGKEEGVQTICYQETGNLLYEIRRKNGHLHGLCEWWEEDGTLLYREFWSKGRLIHEKKWTVYDDGRKMALYLIKHSG